MVHNKGTNTFSIVIPAWNEADQIAESVSAAHDAIRFVSQQNDAYRGDVIVVNNNSSDNTAGVAEQAGATVVFEPYNQIARARNTGANASDADWLIFLDADTSLNANLLGETIHSLASGNTIGGGSTVTFDRELQGIARLMVKGWNWWSVTIGAAAGCYVFCVKEAFNAVGGFDERQYAAEELYLSKQLRKLAKQRGQQFVILQNHPIVTSARKIQWYSGRQKLTQILLLLIPGTTRSKKWLSLWYDRSKIKDT